MKRLRQLFRSNTRGDTIVEVLIATAIISLILVSGYSLSNRSTRTVQDSREHQQALSVANTEVEFLRRNAGLDTVNNDCFDDSGNTASTAPVNDGCSFTPGGQSGCALSTSAYCYTVRVTESATTEDPLHKVSPISVTYKIDVNWDSLLGGKSAVQLFYRVSQIDPAYVPIVVPGQPVPVLPPGTGGTDGPPAIGGGNCKPGSPLPPTSCTPPVGPPTYHYTQAFVNQTTKVPDAQIAACTWNFGDGTVLTGPATDPANACRYNQYRAHSYKADLAGKLRPFPQDCRSFNFVTTMTIIKTDGNRTIAATYVVKMPQCW